MLYKQSDARFARSVGIAVITAVGAYVAYSFFSAYKEDGDGPTSLIGGISLAILLVFMIGGFIAMFVRQKSADFAIEVETETRKVTWPDWPTVKTSTGQVIVVMIALLGFLFAIDLLLGFVRQVVL